MVTSDSSARLPDTQDCGSKLGMRPQCGANVVDRTGHRYGRLVVFRREGSRGTAATWLCQCDCGNTHLATSNALRDDYTTSCGCARKTGKGSRPIYRCSHPPGAAARKYVRKQYRYSAKKKGLDWALTDEQFFALIEQPCHYCGSPPQRIAKVSRNGEYICNGVDRLDNAAGYTAENCVPCCRICNHAKATMTVAEFYAWLADVCAHLSKRGWSPDRVFEPKQH